MKVYDYLANTAVRDPTSEFVSEFLQRCKKYEFPQADILNMINLRPSAPSAIVELYSIVDSFFERYEKQKEEIVQMIVEELPPRPVAIKDDEELVPLETVSQVEEKDCTEPQQEGPHPQPEPMIEG